MTKQEAREARDEALSDLIAAMHAARVLPEDPGALLAFGRAMAAASAADKAYRTACLAEQIDGLQRDGLAKDYE